MSNSRLQLFRHAFSRAGHDFQMVEAAPEPKQHNGKRATAHWRQLLDKVCLLQALIGLEDSVNSWLPQDSMGAPSLPLSSEQLAELIKTAEPIASLRTQVASVKDKAQCQHVAERLATGANQHAAWIVCWDCHARWKVDKSVVTSKTKKEKPQAKAKALASMAGAASSADIFQEEMKARSLAQQKKEQIYQEHVASLQQLTQVGQDEVRRLRAQLEMSVKERKITEIMMSEYGAMAMGAHYVENQGYHDSEMYTYAEKRFETQLEMDVLQQIQEESVRGSDQDMASAAAKRQPRAKSQSGNVWKESLKGSREKEKAPTSRSPSRSRKHG